MNEISERAQSLQASEERYRGIFNSATLAIMVWDTSGDIIEWNPHAEKLFGWSRDEAIGRKALELIVPDDVKPVVQDVIDTLLKQESPRPNVNENLTKSGGRIWCEWYNTPLRDHRGEVVAVLSMATDISERVRAERALRLLKSITAAANAAESSEQALKIALDEVMAFTGWFAGATIIPAGDGQFKLQHVRVPPQFDTEEFREKLKERRWGADGTTTVGRVAASKKLEWATDDEIQQNPSRFANADVAAQLGLKSLIVFPLMVRDVVAAMILFASDKSIPRDPLLVELMSDVGIQLGRVLERDEAGNVLRESEMKFRTLAESASVMIGMIQGKQVLYMNPFMAALTGYTQQELASMTVPQTIHPDSHPLAMERMRRRVAGEPVPNTVEYKMLKKDGSTFFMEITSSEMIYRGVPTSIGVGIDVTERNRIHHELQQSESMLRSLNAELSRAEDRQRRQLAALLHDDLAQTLFAATAQLVALRKTLAPEAQQKQLDGVIAKLDESLRKARDLTYELCPPVLYEVGLVPALANLAERFSERYKTKFTLKPSGDAVRLESDLAGLLYQAVRELLLNVVKHANAKHAEIPSNRIREELRSK